MRRISPGFTLIELPAMRDLRPCSGRAGFTLIELLVVFTIIVVLLALLVPAMDKAIGSAASVVCASHLRQWSVAMRGYSLDYKGSQLFLDNAGPPNYWQYELAPYMGQPDFGKTQFGGYIQANICPEVRIVPVRGSSNSAGGGFGSAHETWTMLNATDSGSYGINCWVTRYPTYENHAYMPRANYFGRYTNVPEDVPILGDSVWVGSWPDHDDQPVPDPQYEYGDITDAPARFMGRYLINRHNMAINLSFTDGSARRVNLGDLWLLRWHKNSKPNASYRGDFSE